MPLTAIVQVNFADVAYVQVSRKSESTNTEPDDVHTYEALLEYEPRAGCKSFARFKTVGGIDHRYGDGAVVLLRKALEALT